MIIILVGPPGSGKTTIREHLEALGWAGFEASTYIQTAMQRYNAAEVEDLPAKAGPSIAARMIDHELATLPPNQPTVISGFRSPNEISLIKAHADVIVIGLYLNINTAYNRIKQRQKTADGLTFDEFSGRVERDFDLGIANILHHHTDVYLNTERAIEVIVTEIQRLKPLPVPIQRTVPIKLKYADRIAIAMLPRI